MAYTRKDQTGGQNRDFDELNNTLPYIPEAPITDTQTGATKDPIYGTHTEAGKTMPAVDRKQRKDAEDLLRKAESRLTDEEKRRLKETRFENGNIIPPEE